MTLLPRTGLPDSYLDGVTPYMGADIALVHGYLESQAIGSLLMQSEGVGARYGNTAFKVTAGTGLSVVIGAGDCIVYHGTYGAVHCERTTDYTWTGLTASAGTKFLFATVEVSGTNDTRATGLPLFVLNATDVLAGGLLLAEISIGASTVTVTTDRRVMATAWRYRGAWSSGASYVFNDMVSSGGQLWYALRTNTAITPVEGADWTLTVAKGATGAAGATGATGATGALSLIHI